MASSEVKCFLLFSNDLKEVKELNNFFEMSVDDVVCRRIWENFHSCNIESRIS